MMNLKKRAEEVKIMIPALFLAMKKKETPVAAKLLAALTVGYALSPIDLIPDPIPVIGYLDDLMILPFLAAMTIRLIPKDILEECKREAEGLWSSGKPQKWFYAIPILLIWAAIIAVIAYKILY